MTEVGEMDAGLQDFTQTFSCESRVERLSFSTFKEENVESDIENVLHLYGDTKIGCKDGKAVNHEQAENIRRSHVQRSSLSGDKKSISWQLFYTEDIQFANYEQFVGIVGISVLPSKLLEPSIRLCSGYHHHKLGTKAVLCIVERLLRLESWLKENVTGVFLRVHPHNTPCLNLKKKLLLGHDCEQKNPLHENGLWPSTYQWWPNEQTRTTFLKHFVWYDCSALKIIWTSYLTENVNRTDFVYLHDALEQKSAQTCPAKRPLPTRESKQRVASPEDVRKRFKWKKLKSDVSGLTESIDDSLQKFSYDFDCGSKRAKLSFQTFSDDQVESELKAVSSIFGDKQVMAEAPGKTLEGATRIRNIFLETNALGGSKQSIRWKVYYTEDTNVKTGGEEFVGFVGMSIGKLRQLSVHAQFLPKYQKRKIGSKSMLCLMHVFVINKEWFQGRVDTIMMGMKPMNEASLALKDKFLGGHTYKLRNPATQNGSWRIRHAYCKENVIINSIKYVCTANIIQLVWENQMKQNVNKADRVLFDAFDFQQTRLLVDEDFLNGIANDVNLDTVLTEPVEELAHKVDLDEAMEKKLQEFSYEFTHGTIHEKLSFRTFSKAGSKCEVIEIFKLFNGKRKMSGTDNDETKICIAQMREETSYSGSQKSFSWKVYTDGADFKSSFIGIVALYKDDRHLIPTIQLVKEYQKKGFGNKIFLCLLIRLLGNKSWFERNFDGIRTTICLENKAALALKKKVLGNFCDEVHILGTRLAAKSTFECNGMARLESLMMAKCPKRGRKEHVFWQDQKEMGTISGPFNSANFGLEELHLDIAEVKGKLGWIIKYFGRSKRDKTPAPLAGKFQMKLPILKKSANTFYMLIFTDSHNLEEFEVLPPRCRVNKHFLAFVSNDSKDGKEKLIDIMLKQPKLGDCTAYVIEFKLNTFEDDCCRLLENTKRVWATNSFTYYKNKKRTEKQKYSKELAFKRTTKIHVAT